MDDETRNQLAGGAAFVVGGIIVLLIGAPDLLGLLMVVVGMIMLGLLLAGQPSIPALLRSRSAGRRRRPRR